MANKEYNLAYDGVALPANAIDDENMARLWSEKLANNPKYQERRKITVIQRTVGEWEPYVDE